MLYQNDGFGKDYLIGLKDGLGADHAGMVIKEASYETSEPTVDSQVVTLQGSGADVFLIAATPKFAAQAIRKILRSRLDAGALHHRRLASIATVIKPAGLEKSKGLITAVYGKDPTDARWKDDPGLKEYAAFIAKYMSPNDLIDSNAVYGFGAAATMIQVLKQCGNDLSRENVMKQAANLKDLELPMLLPGMKINTSPDNYSPIRQMQLAHVQWRELGAVRGAAHRLSERRPRAFRAPIMALAAAGAGEASPNPRQHRVEHRVGGDDRNAAAKRRGGQEAIERVAMRPFHRPRHEAILRPRARSASASLAFGEGRATDRRSGSFPATCRFCTFLRDLEKRNRAHHDVVCASNASRRAPR